MNCLTGWRSDAEIWIHSKCKTEKFRVGEMETSRRFPGRRHFQVTTKSFDNYRSIINYAACFVHG